MKNLNVHIISEVLEDCSMMQHPIIDAIGKYKRHSSILKLRSKSELKIIFILNIFMKKMADVLKDLNVRKAKHINDIPLKLTKENIDVFSSILSQMFNFHIDKISFPNSLYKTDITAIHKKDDTNGV